MMQPPTHASKQVWIGLVHVRPRSGNLLLEGAAGAYVPVVALASGEQSFEEVTKGLLEEYGFDVVEIDDVQLFADRLENSPVAPAVQQMALELSEESPVALDTFQAYEDE